LSVLLNTTTSANFLVIALVVFVVDIFLILILIFLDPPSAPGIPNVTEVGEDFVNLSWDKPESDGGSRVQGYWIDKREVVSEAWQRVNLSICFATQINISNLIEGRQYEFRVFAQNEAGLSPPSSASTSVKIKDPLSMYFVL
jgi:hypothetical protein